MKRLLLNRNVYTFAAAIAAALCVQPSVAQEPASKSANELRLEEIVVTARKTEERLIDVPLSVTAITSEAMRERSLQDVRDLAAFTPGFSYTASFGRANQERPVIRGQSNILGKPNASFFVDGIYISGATVTTEIANLERIEVLKGPQATQYGRSTYAGAINYVTKKPCEQFCGQLEATVAQHKQVEAAGSISGPLIDGTLYYYLAGRHYEFGGEYDNTFTGKKLGDESTNSGTVKLRWTPSDGVDVNWLFTAAKDKDGPFALGFETRDFNNCVPRGVTAPRSRGYRCGEPVGNDQLIFAQRSDLLPRGGGLDRTRLRTALSLKWQFGEGYEFSANSAYSDEKYKYASDVSYAAYDAFRGLDPAVIPAIPSGDVGNIIRQYLNSGSFWRENWEKRKDFAQEVRMSSPTDRKLSWAVGGYYFHSHDDQVKNDKIFPDGVEVPNGTSALTLEETHNTAFFVSAQYKFNDRWTASFEHRHAKDLIEQVNLAYPSVSIANFNAGMGAAGIPSSVGYTTVSTPSGTFLSDTPRFSLRYKPGENSTFYVTYSEGNKPGGFNTGAVVPVLVAQGISVNYSEERIKSYETGAKLLMLDGRLRFNLAAYFNKLANQQLTSNLAGVNPITGLTVLGSYVSNLGETQIKGIDLEVNAKLTKHWDVSLGYAYTHAEITAGVLQDQADLYSPRTAAVFNTFNAVTNPTGCLALNPPAGQLTCQALRNLDNQQYGDLAGKVPPRAPVHQGFITSRYDFPLSNGMTFYVAGDLTYESSKFDQVHNLLETGDRQSVNARFGLEGASWTVSLWGKNLADDDTPIDILRYVDTRLPLPAGFSVTSSPRGFAMTPARRRQVGLTASYKF